MFSRIISYAGGNNALIVVAVSACSQRSRTPRLSEEDSDCYKEFLHEQLSPFAITAGKHSQPSGREGHLRRTHRSTRENCHPGCENNVWLRRRGRYWRGGGYY